MANIAMTEMLKKVAASNRPAYDEIVKHWVHLPGKPVDVEGLCDAIAGVRWERSAAMPEGVSGCIVKNGKDDFQIIVNRTEPRTRQRFTLAHELAHFLLHKEYLGDKFPENTLLRGGLSSQEEAEANQLATDILMPYHAVDKHIMDNKGEITIVQLAEAFDVSKAAMSVRLGTPLDY